MSSFVCRGKSSPRAEQKGPGGISPPHTPWLPSCAFPEKMPMCVWPLHQHPKRCTLTQVLQTPQHLLPLEIHSLVQSQPQAEALELKIVILLGRLMKKDLVKFLTVLTNIRKYLNDKSVEEGGK